MHIRVQYDLDSDTGLNVNVHPKCQQVTKLASVKCHKCQAVAIYGGTLIKVIR